MRAAESNSTRAPISMRPCIGREQPGDALQGHALAGAGRSEHDDALVLGFERGFEKELAAVGDQPLANVDTNFHAQ